MQATQVCGCLTGSTLASTVSLQQHVHKQGRHVVAAVQLKELTAAGILLRAALLDNVCTTNTSYLCSSQHACR